MTVIAGANDVMTRQWCEALQKKSRYNDNMRVFSKSLTELALRPGATSFVPQFIRDGLELLFRRSLNNPTLFTASVNAQSVDRVRETINRGKMPTLHDHSDDSALAQTILSFYAEMPESLIPGILFSDLWSYYVDSLKAGTPVLDRLKELLLRLPVPNQVNLKYLLTFFAIWAEESRTKMRLPELLGSYLIRVRGEDVSLKGQTTDIILKIFEDLLAFMEQLPFPTDEAFADFVKNSATTSAATSVPDLRIPVTVIDKEDTALLLQSVENSHLVLDLDDIGPSPTPTSSHKHTASMSGCDPDGDMRGSSGPDSFDDEEVNSEGSTDSPRREKHSTRSKASHLFKKFRQSIRDSSFSARRRNHTAGNTPTNSIQYAGGSPDDDSSEGCGTPTGSYAPSAPIAVPQPNQLQEKSSDTSSADVDSPTPESK